VELGPFEKITFFPPDPLLEAMAHDEGFKIKNTTQIMAFFLQLISRHTATISKQNILLAELGQNI
jgi:hypothetical protein